KHALPHAFVATTKLSSHGTRENQQTVRYDLVVFSGTRWESDSPRWDVDAQRTCKEDVAIICDAAVNQKVRGIMLFAAHDFGETNVLTWYAILFICEPSSATTSENSQRSPSISCTAAFAVFTPKASGNTST